jgi:hypothetical protein
LRSDPRFPFDDACSRLAQILDGTTRAEILAGVSTSGNFRQSLLRLCDGMRTNVWKAGARQISLEKLVRDYDAAARDDGFHVLHDWDGKAGRNNEDTIAVDVLNFVVDHRGKDELDRTALAILLDYYLLYLLSLLSLHLWADGDPDANFDRLNALLASLQGPNGSGQQFAHGVGTLLILAGSHFEAKDTCYDVLLERVKALSPRHRADVALVHASALGCHLRFGYEVTYNKSLSDMRDDNVVDYSWLVVSLADLMREYERLRETGTAGPALDAIVEALLNGLSPDPGAFAGDAPAACMAAHEADWREFRARFDRFSPELLPAFDALRPSARTYSPLSLFFNFSINVLKGTVIDALLWGEAWTIGLDDALTAVPFDPARGEAKTRLANTLMRYARASPDTIRGRLMPAIVYDPPTGRRMATASCHILLSRGR